MRLYNKNYYYTSKYTVNYLSDHYVIKFEPFLDSGSAKELLRLAKFIKREKKCF